jgi:IMP dehydrogenase
MSQPQFKQMRRAYGFDDVAIVPGGTHTINPSHVELSFKLGKFDFQLPFIAAAMDGVTDVRMCTEFSKLGGLAVLNLEGVQTRYDDPAPVLAEIAKAPKDKVTALMQKAYSTPIRPELIGERVAQIKKGGGIAAVSATPMNTKKFAALAKEAGVDVFVVQSTVTSARHISSSEKGLIFDELVERMGDVPVVVGNTVTFSATKELMETGIAGVLIGVGPGAACTSREVLGVGVPQVTATIDAAAARDTYYRETGRYVPIITDGGITNGGAMCKAFAAGADAVMLGSILAATEEAPGHGHHWGMATPSAELPRGTRVRVGIDTTLQKTLFGPTSRTDGRENLVGALKTSMGTCGARTIRDFQKTEMVIAPAIKTEGKSYQIEQG